MDSYSLERAVLGSMINNPSCLGIGLQVIPDEGAFRSIVGQSVFKTLLEMSFTATVVDVFTAKKALEEKGVYKYVGDEPWGDIVMEEHPLHVFEKHIEILVDDYRLRRLQKMAEIVLGKAKEKSETSQELISAAMIEMEAIMKTDRRISIISAGKVINQIKQDVIDLASGVKKEIGIPCGFESFGSEFGYKEGNLTILAARPAMGKSAFMVQLAKNLVYDQKVPVGIISMEMKAKENLYRLLANLLSLNTRSIEKGFYNNAERENFYASINQFMSLPLFINETYDMDYIALRANIVTLVKTFGCKVVFIDHLGLVNITKLIKDFKSESSALGQVTRMLKILATELGIEIVALHQLSRAVEERKPPRPMLSDLRASGNIEQDANKVLFLYRPDYYAEPGITPYDSYGRDLSNITEVILAKNRNGGVGHWYFETEKEKSRYKESAEFNQNKPTISKSKR
jgi:replicative DNA helicase